MSTTVFLVVLLAACLHATWNSLLKASSDKHATMLAVALGHIPLALAVLPFTADIDPVAIPWILTGIALHLGYQIFLVAGYQFGDLTLVYPIARGSAPIIVTMVSILLLGISFTTHELAGVALIAIGLLSLSLVRCADGMRNPRAALLALCTGAFIAAYSLVDGIGARLAGSALGFWSWAAIGNAIGLFAWTAFTKPDVVASMRRSPNLLLTGLAGGTASYIAYGLVIWAFTHAPIALVTALRETSILFALVIGVLVLKERLNILKVFSTAATLGGAILLRLSKP